MPRDGLPEAPAPRPETSAADQKTYVTEEEAAAWAATFDGAWVTGDAVEEAERLLDFLFFPPRPRAPRE